MDRRNRVFINPNFNKKISNIDPARHQPVMHVNPNFSQNMQLLPKAKIYINPNFVRPNSANTHSSQYVSNTKTSSSFIKSSPLVDSSNTLSITVSVPPNHRVQSLVQINSATPTFGRPNAVNNQIRYEKSGQPMCYTKPNPFLDSSNKSAAFISAPTRHQVQNSIQTSSSNHNFATPHIRNNRSPQYLKNNHRMHSYTMSSLPIPSKPPTTLASVLARVEPLIQTSTAPTKPYQTHSRYSLVRQNKPIEPTNILKLQPQTSTIKVSKYKSIKITDVRKNLDTVKPVEKLTPFKVSNNHKSLTRISNQKVISKSSPKVNRYKLVRPSMGKPQFKRQTTNTPKKVICTRVRIKGVGVYKKNNIPCPQFRKYGKCLRKSYGKCEYLHDRKHVSICRKFLSGVCHDEKCLLSHELSDKKMPTCYFYLKGMCTKEECPYLHVKLNERAKICTDFMKGYCEKGEKCLHRHVAKSPSTDLKKRHSLKKSQQKLMKYKVEKNKIRSSIGTSTQKRKSRTQLNQNSSQENDVASRYYKELVQEASTSDSMEIKPSRCKLGSLPSFIQL